jgi:paired amphipathic helix protein Sin3a
VQTILTDVKSQDLLELLKKERALSQPTGQDQLNNRRNAEKVLGPDENLFRIDWVRGWSLGQKRDITHISLVA